jgi:DNA-binding NarL/FixJ family response regulator
VTRIVLADDHEVVRRGLRDLLIRHAGWQVCGEASTGREAVDLALTLQPDVVVLDLSMPELGGLDATRQILARQPNAEVLIFSMHDSEQLVREVLTSGARGYVLKSETSQHLVAAVEALAQHQPYFVGAVAERVLASLREEQRSTLREGTIEQRLTSRQLEIARLVAEGKSNKEIAAILHMSVATAKTHRAAIMRRLNAKSVVELVHYAVRNGLVAP